MTLEEFYNTDLGKRFAEKERKMIGNFLLNFNGETLVQIGGVQKDILLSERSPLHCFYFMTNDTPHESFTNVKMYYREMPLLPNSVDMIVLPHTLETVAFPHILLHESYQALKPEGYLLIFCFRVLSWTSLQACFRNPHFDWKKQYWPILQLKRLLRRMGYTFVKKYSLGDSFALLVQKKQYARIVEKIKTSVWEGTPVFVAEPAKNVVSQSSFVEETHYDR